MELFVFKSVVSIYQYDFMTILISFYALGTMFSNVPVKINLQRLFEIASKHTDFKDQEKAFYA